MRLRAVLTFLVLVLSTILLVAGCGRGAPPAATALPAPTSTRAAATPTEAALPSATPEEPAATATQAAPPSPEAALATATTLPATATVEGGGPSVSLTYDPAVAGSTAVETVPAGEATPGAPYWAIYPQHTRVSFEGYPLAGTLHEPQILVYPAAEFAAMNPAAATRIESLKALLAEQPLVPPAEIPFLPLFNAAQVFHAQVQYMPFQNGTGIRFLTQYDQAPLPINNQELFYTFQGLTTDGSYYVAAILPVSAPVLPDDAESGMGADWDSIAQNMPAYLEETARKLDELAAEEFEPSLVHLDTLIQSLAVATGEPAPPVTETPVSGSQQPVEPIELVAPAAGATITSPVEVRGNVQVTPFEATLVGRVYDADGRLAGEAPILVEGELGGPGTFTGRIEFDAGAGGPGTVEIVELSPKDGSVVARGVVEVVLVPSG